MTITLHSCFITRPKANLFCSKLRNPTVRRDSRTILSNQKSVFTQLTVTFICCKTDLNVGSKTRNLLFNTFCSNLAKEVARVCYSFYRGLNYYINTNEIPGELSRENLISSHVKITCYLHMWKYRLCYGYIINRAFHTKKLLSEMVWYLIGVYIINKTLHGRLKRRSLVKYFSILEEKFRISARPCNILYLFKSYLNNLRKTKLFV